MGTIGVFNLATSALAAKAGSSASRSDYVTPLAGHHWPTTTLGSGSGIEGAVVKGHYLVLEWAGLTTGLSPSNRYQRGQLQRYLLVLFNNTANVSLSNRLISGNATAGG